MDCWLLEVTVISAKDLEDVRDILKMHPFVVAFLSGDEGHREGQRRTPTDWKGDTNPSWNHAIAPSFTFDLAAALDGRLTLKLEIKTERTVKGPKDIGWVDVPVQELLEQGGDGGRWQKSFPVRLHSGGTRGTLELSYKFRVASIVPGAPPHPPPHQTSPDQRPPKKGGDLLRAAVIANVMLNLCGDLCDVET